MVIPCLCSFLLTVPSSAFSELPVNKKRTRTLFRKESGSSTNCMVDGTGLEQHGRAQRNRKFHSTGGYSSIGEYGILGLVQQISLYIKENIDEAVFMFALFKCRKSDKGRN